MATPDPARACRSCRCPRLRTYRPSDTYCAACGHRADEHVERPAAEPILLVPAIPVVPVVPAVSEPPLAAITPTLDEPLEEGWLAVLPSGRFFAVAIASAGVGLIVAGLAMRFETLLMATPLLR